MLQITTKCVIRRSMAPDVIFVVRALTESYMDSRPKNTTTDIAIEGIAFAGLMIERHGLWHT